MASSLLRRGFRLPLSSPFVSGRSLITASSPLSTAATTSRHGQSCSCCVCATATSRHGQSCSCCVCRGGAGTVSFGSSFPPSVRRFSSKVGADVTLKKVLDSEIQQAKEGIETDEQYPLPQDFPFTIQDNSGDQSITLEREYSGEKIHAAVFLNLEADEQVENDDDEQTGDEADNDSLQSNISMVITIDKGADSFMEFCCTVNAEELQIDSMTIKKHEDDGGELYEGPPFSDLDEKLQGEFHKYLQERGFKSSLFGFLQNYMIKKDEREYTTWLTSMKEFLDA